MVDFLGELEVSVEEELLEFNLAPLGLRRDVAMMGILFKVSRREAPGPIQGLFSLYPENLDRFGFRSGGERHSRQLLDPVAFHHPVMIRRSVFGLIKVFNRLPQKLIDAANASCFQRMLQNQAKDAAQAGIPDWELMFRAAA